MFAALLSDNKTSDLLFSGLFSLYAPMFLLEEFGKYKTLLLSKTKRDEQAFITLMSILKRHIRLIPEDTIRSHLPTARSISPDPDDAPYFAAAIAMDASIWSNDKRLRSQEGIPIITTKELLDMTNQ